MAARNTLEVRPPASRSPSRFQLSLAALSPANLAAASPETAGQADDAAIRALRSALSSPEPEFQRGRKRGRSPLPFAIVAAQSPSGESSTFRGRRRYRSTSLINFSSRNTSGSFRDASHSPSKKRILHVFQIDRRRSQSPSRSQSPFHKQEPPTRRRRRTRSHSRNHKTTSLGTVDLKSPLQFEIMPEPKETTGSDKR